MLCFNFITNTKQLPIINKCCLYSELLWVKLICLRFIVFMNANKVWLMLHILGWNVQKNIL